MAILNTNVNNANIKFLNGLQSNLNNLIANGGAIKGAFYLTSDTHRLYIGQEDNNRTDLENKIVPVPVNEGVTTVASIANLPSVATGNDSAGVAGSFYYASNENILCVYNGKTWVQINPDTNTTIDYFYHDIVTDNNTATISSKLKDNNGNITSANLDLIGTNGITISSVSDASFTGNTFEPNARKQITITGDSYNISQAVASNTATITLASSDTNKSSSNVQIIGGDNVTIEADNGKIKITSTDTYINSLAVSNALNNGNGFRIIATDNKGNTNPANFDPIIHFDVDGGADYHFVNGIANLPLYTKDEIDVVLRQLNSMVYKGVIGYGQILTQVPDGNSVKDTNNNVRLIYVGDTYKIGASDNQGGDNGVDINIGSSQTTTVHKGDLIIAQGTEYTATDPAAIANPALIGTINPTTLYWGYVPAGDDTFVETTYTGIAIQNGIKLVDSGSTNVAQFKVIGDNDYITITDSADLTGSSIPSENTVTVHHKLVDTSTYQDTTVAVSAATTQTADNTMNIPIITNIQRDAAGHVLSITTTGYRVTDTVSEIGTYTTNTESDVNNTYSKVSTKLTLKDAGNVTISDETTNFVIESSTMQVSSTTKTIDTKTFNSVKMELIWGSFA